MCERSSAKRKSRKEVKAEIESLVGFPGYFDWLFKDLFGEEHDSERRLKKK